MAGICSSRARLAVLAIVAVALPAVMPLHAGATRDDPLAGGLIAAFVQKSEILLMSDGRVLSPADGMVAREDLSKIHRLSRTSAVLTAGRVLSGLMPRARPTLASSGANLLGHVSAIREALEAEWLETTGGATGLAAGRTYVFVAGFDEQGAPRVFHLDTRVVPGTAVSEITVLGAGRELDVVAVSSTLHRVADASDVIVRHISALHAKNAGLSRRALLIAAFKAAQAEMAAYDPHVGGQTFAAVIDRTEGFRTVDVGD